MGAPEDSKAEETTATTPVEPAEEKDEKAPQGKKRARPSIDQAKIRTRLAQVVWALFVLAALILAVGALLVALDNANESNGLVGFVMDTADAIDLGVFSRDNGVFTFSGDNAETKNALVNWGLGAVVYLVVGRLLERILRPSRV